MSKLGYISRYMLILKKLKQKPYATVAEIQSYIDYRLEFIQERDGKLGMGSSKRTLQRDFREIEKLFSINIEYSKIHKGYFVSENIAADQNFERLMEEFEILNALRLANDMRPYVYFEKRKPLGTENLYGLLHAIKNHVIITFTYEKFWEDTITGRSVEPYALKEFNRRWYLMAKETKTDYLKSFALDRLTNLQISNKKFTAETRFNIEQQYRYSFGIISSPSDEQPQDIILRFHPEQGKYIKTMPLHHTQQILVDNDDELQIKLKLCITFDFIMELLSHGEYVKVIRPQSLVNEVKAAHEKAFRMYG